MSGVFAAPSRWMDEETILFEESTARFFAEAATAQRMEDWRRDGIVDRAAWTEAAQAGLLGVSVSPDYGGAGGDFRHEAVIMRRLGVIGAEGWAIPLHNAICAAYIEKYGTEAQKQRWLPLIVSGERITAVAMTEPGAGSDLRGIRTTARREGDHYVLQGQKTFITNGQLAELIIVVAKTDPEAGGKGISLLLVDTADAPGFSRGRNLDKIGVEMGDTSELFFDNVRVPVENLLGGEEGQGLYQLMKELPKERLIIAIECVAIMEAALDHTIAYVRERRAFGQRLLDFQNTQFVLAECKTEATIARSFVDDCIVRFGEGALDAATASMAKYWVSERAQKIVDACLQLFGGYGYMTEYPIAQMYKDVRVKRIYGGANEIMKVLIARTLDQ
nr:acyl-CoA dehydrogenase family protein [uncultured Brevundimonas sp.]